MSKTRNNLLLSLISFFKYSMILLGLISFPKIKSDSEITFKITCQGCQANYLNNNHWPPVFSNSFQNTKSSNYEISKEYIKIGDGESNVVVTFNGDINSYAKLFERKEDTPQIFEEITLVDFKTPKVNSMQLMFHRASFKKITFQNVDTSLVEDMSYMFENCERLETVDLSSLNTESVKTMNSMFKNCKNLKKVELKNIDTPLLTDMNQMFENCYNLEQVDISSLSTTTSIITINSLFKDCNNLKKVDLKNLDIADMSHMFENHRNLEQVVISNEKAASVTNMNSMFKTCEKLKNVDLQKLDTSKVTDISHMFEECYNLEKLNLSEFSTVSVTTMNSTFRNCHNLQEIDMRNFDTSKVTDMDFLFEFCKVLKEIDLSNWNTGSVVSMNSTFRYCEKIKVIDARSFDTSKVTNMYDLFGYCAELVYLNVSSFNTQSVKVMQGIFIQCHKLRYIDIHQFDYTAFLSSCPPDKSNFDWCRFHYTFAYSELLMCVNFITFYFEDRVNDHTFEASGKGLTMKFCVDENNIKVNDNKLKDLLKNSCNDPCFSDMLKKFDISSNAYVDECAPEKFDFRDLCWDDCPYHYYRIYTDRKTCSKEEPDDNYFYDSGDNIYYKCYSSCTTCIARGSEVYHYCKECAEDYSFISIAEDKYALSNNCYEKCGEKTYYFNSNHEYFCVDTCPTDYNYKLIEKKNKCIDKCTNDDTYTKEFENTCVTQCTKGTADIEDICKPCYESCGECNVVGYEEDHKCTKCKEGYSNLNKDSNCYEDCNKFYYFDSDNKYKCEDNCLNGYKLIGGTNKCIDQCKNDKIFESKYEYNGGCYKNCPKGSYQKDGKDYCKCMVNTTCESCTSLAIENNKCTTCNIEGGFYPKKEDINYQYMECYNDETIPDNYILIHENNQYESCYGFCATCESIGTSEKEQKCKTCISDYTDLNGDGNCYKNCEHYFYFNNEGKYICLSVDECPEEYKLLIDTKNKCIKECKNDNIYHYIYEYNGKCYKTCSNGYYEEGEGDNKKYVCKCDKNDACKDCPKSNSGNNLCSTCNDGYYPKEDEPKNNGLFNCYNSSTILKNYFLNTETSQYELCFANCGSCNAKGTSLLDQKCIDCKDETYEKLNNDDNCYKICENYYYFDENKNYICLNEKKCKPGYKLIDDTNKCIDECKNDKIFESKYEYNGGCYKNCQKDSYQKDGKDYCKCMVNEACQDCPSENNENNLCSICNTGFYPIKGEKDKLLKNCYNSDTIPENYIFNSAESQYEACYESCQTCATVGNSESHQCTTCKNGYNEDNEHSGNCVQKCEDYFYYEGTTLTCTEGKSCPYNYKLIHLSKKCVPNCKAENLYEYDNICYDICDNGFYTENDENICKCKTNIACKKCPISNENTDLCNSCNTEKEYYPIKGENENALYHCYDSRTIPENYYLNTENADNYLYELCYETCGSCYGKGTAEDHNCKKCKDGYEKLNNNNNCYSKCNKLYYFDSNNAYHCEDNCLGDYKIINGTNKCIDECKNDNIFDSKYEYNGGCYKTCPNGFYTEGEGENQKMKCYCMSNIACKDCPSEDNENHLCSTCNLDKNYYPIEDESSSTLKHCYNVTTKPSNYILISGEYKKCYISCKTCDLLSTSENEHNCKDCKDNYIKLKDNDNCYEICSNYYYFDDNDKYVCLNKNECPPEYKLIYETNQCIKECSKVNKYEYDNICYSECPTYYTDTNGDHICKLNCKYYQMYYNFEKTTCLSTIPNGYYLANEDDKILGKCHENCAECRKGATDNNNNCLKCPNIKTIYYELGNCLETCVNGFYTDENSIKKCKCSNNVACKDCNERGNCFSCNKDEGYYPKETNDEEDNNIIECFKNPEGYYLYQNAYYKKCYEKCKYCSDEGEDKCTECISQYEFRNDFTNDNKCYKKCIYNYYYDSDNNNMCTIDSNCPNGMKLIEPKKRCIDQCKNDNKYKFEYKGKCYISCPDNTRKSSADNSICEDIKDDTDIGERCNLNYNEIDDFFNDTLTSEDLSILTTQYASKYHDTDNYITKIENEYFKIFIYNNIICLQKVSQDAKLVDFGESFLNILSNNHVSSPIITIVSDKKTNSSNYAVADPNTGVLLDDANAALRNLDIQVLEDIYSSLSYLGDIKREYIIHMLKQGINVFDPNNKFYTNLCFYYDSPNDKDIPMSDRPYFYANVQKCDNGCTYKGIDYTLIKFKCDCRSTPLDGDGDTTPGAEETTTPPGVYNGYPKKKNSPNIEVFKCMGDAFKSEYFKKSPGGIIMLILSIGQIACMTLYLLKGIKDIKKHTHSLYSAYKNYTGKEDIKNDANPPKKDISNNKSKVNNKRPVTSSKLNLKKDLILINTMNKEKKSSEKTIDNYNNKNNNKNNNNKRESKKKVTIDIKEIKDVNEKKVTNELINETHEVTQYKTEEKFEKLNNSNISNDAIKVDDIYIKMIQEFLNPDFDENDFDDAINKDRRTFLQFFTEKSFKNQIFIKTFYIKHIFKPLFLKIMLLILFIELYFVISALFYSESYLSDRFYSNDKEFFLSFVSKRIDEIIFTLIICGIIQYFCSYFFDNDDYLRRIFTNKINKEMDSALAEFIKNIKRKFIILMVISITVTILAFFYLTSFNAVYPYIKEEWITCSFLILVLMQIINLVSTLLGTCCRYLSIRWNNIKLFRLSLNLD